jgi:hypothetical protein
MTMIQVVVLAVPFALTAFLLYGVYWALVAPTTWRRRAARVCLALGVVGYASGVLRVLAGALADSPATNLWLGATLFLIVGVLLGRRANRMEAGQLRDSAGLVETETSVGAAEGPRDVSWLRYFRYWVTGR